MDPTLQTPTPISPYSTANPGTGQAGISTPQLQAIIQALQAQKGGANQQNGPASTAQPGASQQLNMPYSNAGNLIKGLMSPAPTSLLGQANNSLFGQNAPLMAALGGPQYGGSSFGAYGGSSANPLPGLSASDYGAGF